ncbi:hypothetical protein [Microbacterium sp.]|uniref:hypothetical protein n=1 Tax=Microbacterium sp. TaxID=51671 RepID=UPI003C790250
MPEVFSPNSIRRSPVPLLYRNEVENLARKERSGDLLRVTRGAYAPTEAWRPLAPWDRYLARVHAVVHQHPGAALTLESAAAVRGLPVFGEPPEVHLLASDPTKTRRMPGIHIHTSERMPTPERIGGLLVASMPDLVVDLGRARHPAVALAVAGAALRADPELSRERLAAVSAARPTARGTRSLEWVLERATPVPESPLEHVAIAAIEWVGFPSPELQKWFRGEHPDEDDRVDLWWDQWKIAGEPDGDIKYSGAFGDAREALRARSTRDARLRRRGVRAIAHWTQRDMVDWPQMSAVLAAAGLPILFPEQTTPLATLGRALRGHPTGGISFLR